MQVLEDEGSQLLTSMDDYVRACGADLVVLATRALSSKVRQVEVAKKICGGIE